MGTARRDRGRNIRSHTRGGGHPIPCRDRTGCSVGRNCASDNRAIHPFVVPVVMVVVMMMVVIVMVIMIMIVVVFGMGGGRFVGVVRCRL